MRLDFFGNGKVGACVGWWKGGLFFEEEWRRIGRIV